MRRATGAAMVVLLGLGAFLVWRWLFPPDEVVIRRVVTQAVTAASWEEQGGMIHRLAAANQLCSLCAPNVEVLMEARGAGSRRLQGRNELREAAVAARSQVAWLRLSVDGVEVAVADSGEEGTVLLAASVEMDGMGEPLLQDYKLGMRKVDGDWLIQRVEPVRGFGQ